VSARALGLEPRHPAGGPGRHLSCPVNADLYHFDKRSIKVLARSSRQPRGPARANRNIEILAVLWIRLAHAQKLGTDFGSSLLQR
jgi:hypothetical protein